VIGVSIELTGSEAIPQLPVGYQEAVNEANAAGGVTIAGVKHPLKLIILDNRSDTSLLTSQVHTLVLADHAVALVSGCCNLNVTEAPLANALHVPLVGTAIPTNLVSSVNGTYGWDVFVSLASPTNYFAKVVNSLGATDDKVALIANNNPEGEGQQAVFEAYAKAANFQVTAKALVPIGTTDYSSFIDQAKQTGADNLVVQMDSPDCFALWKQMKALGYQPKTALANQCGAIPTWRGLGSLGNGTLLGLDWTPQSGLPEAAKMASVFSRTYPNDVVDQEVAVNGYTAMEVLISAIEHANSVSPTAINTAIGETDGPFPLGIVKFDSQHDWGGSTINAQWQNGNVVQVYPPVPGVKAEFPVTGLAG
jgi:ABC-type branched-subunit amino acid transport system substrate-binding protein